MKWTELRQQFPNQWVVVEAIQAYSEDSTRHIEEMALLANFPDSTEAWKKYKEFHLADPNREYYMLHTNHKELKVKEQKMVSPSYYLQ